MPYILVKCIDRGNNVLLQIQYPVTEWASVKFLVDRIQIRNPDPRLLLPYRYHWAYFNLYNRSRRLSVLQRPMNNWVLNFSLLFETLLAFIIIYVPGTDEVRAVQLSCLDSS
jgi:hypothetical protein